MNTKILDAIAAFRDAAQAKERLREEVSACEERLKAIGMEMDETDRRWSDARKAMLEAILAE